MGRVNQKNDTLSIGDGLLMLHLLPALPVGAVGGRAEAALGLRAVALSFGKPSTMTASPARPNERLVISTDAHLGACFKLSSTSVAGITPIPGNAMIQAESSSSS